MYLSYRMQSDIAFVMEQLSSHNSDLQASNFHIAKQVLQYLKKTNIIVIIR